MKPWEGRGDVVRMDVLSVLRADPDDKPANESRLGFFCGGGGIRGDF